MLTNTQTNNEVWQNCLNSIKSCIPSEEFEKWFEPIVPLKFDGTTLRLCIPNKTYYDKIEKDYISFLRPIISQFYGQQTKLYYAVQRPAASTSTAPVASVEADMTAISHFNTQTNTDNIKNPFVIPGVKKIVIDPQLNAGLTFDTFVEGECNRLARSAGMSVAITPGNTPFNPLYIWGDSGLGKTHIMQAIGHEVRQRHPELQVLYVSMNKFQAQFQTAYKKGEIPDFIHFYQTIDVLLIDDIQELTGKTGTQNAFFNIFNHLQLAGKQLVLTSDKPPVELKDIEERLLTRFKWGLSAQIGQPDYDTKVKIIRAKAKKLGADISDEVVAFMATNISANVREIEGALAPAGKCLVPRAQNHDFTRKRNLEGIRSTLSERDHHRPYHRGGMRISSFGFCSVQLDRTHTRNRPSAPNRHVPGQTAHESTAYDHRCGYRRT